MAQIGWIDFSNRDRKKAQQLMSLIRPEGQLDELGVGYIRDALGNLLFPGISTIQTRAKYFFIVPNIFRDYQKLSPADKRRTTPRLFLKEQEHKVKNKLRELYNYEEGHGIIGVTLRERQYIKRNPSEIYWAGLQVYNFMNDIGLSQEQYLRNMSASQPLEKAKTKEEEDDTDSNYEETATIHTPVNNRWFNNLQIELDKEESDFFVSQILQVAPHRPYSLLPQLLKNQSLATLFLDANNFQEFVTDSLDLDYSAEVKNMLVLAHDFALLMEGVHLLYNHLLQQHFFAQDYEDDFEDDWKEWRENLEDDMIDYASFSPQNLYRHTRYSRANTEYFISSWWRLVTASKKSGAPSAHMKELVKQREQIAKGKKSRLSKLASANNDIELKQRIGLSLFQYRFYNARTIMGDIQKPLAI